MSVSGGDQSARSALAASTSGDAPGQQVLAEPLEVALAHPAGRRQLVGVARDAGRRQLVDVGEHELGEAGDGRRRQPHADDRAGQLPPGHAGPDAVGGQQRVHRPAAARLAAPQRVRPLDRRLQRRARVGVVRLLGEAQERPEGHLHGQLDVGAHLAGERAGVAGHLGGDGLDGALGDLRQVARRASRRPAGRGPDPPSCPLTAAPSLDCPQRTDGARFLTPHGYETSPQDGQTRCMTAPAPARPVLGRLRERVGQLAELVVTPLVPADYVDLIDPLRSDATACAVASSRCGPRPATPSPS